MSVVVCRRDIRLGWAYVQPALVAASELEENSTSSVSAATNMGWATNSFSPFEAGSSSVVSRR